ncbi:MAG: antitoxin family protein [Spirochaetes bacterium]|nr:antitoxin family protein [Spirochaetota bacterium]
MEVRAIYEDGVFIPKEEIELKEHQEVIIYYWTDIKNKLDLEKAYAEASKMRHDLDEWDSVNVEGWPDD